MNSTGLRMAAMPATVLVLILGACSAAGSSSGATSRTASASVPASAIASVALPASPSEEPSPEPSDELGEFDCSFPVTGDGTVARAQITGVRVGMHPSYDRVVFEFGNGIPQFTLDEATPPLLKDPSGQPLEVEGNAFWQLVMQGGTRMSPMGVETYVGPLDFTPGFPQLTELIEGGDFEAVSTWYLGLESNSCARVITLANPSRLVIDIEH
ncbi:MAG TPA: hypothetical protein VES36_03335 [Candidatus Limnocylindrales bacterium]|nr:hypothetical protein [Candidatus Limnocylindrales bacterium]